MRTSIIDDKRLANNRRFFEYHCYEGEDSGDAELWHHTHQQVTILCRANTDREVGRVYRVKFADGFEYDAMDDELVKSPSDYYRPDYRRIV